MVKLTDFGLSTHDVGSDKIYWGSAPYMSYRMFSTFVDDDYLSYLFSLTEYRNKLSPTYSPRVADVWYLGIVLINM